MLDGIWLLFLFIIIFVLLSLYFIPKYTEPFDAHDQNECDRQCQEKFYDYSMCSCYIDIFGHINAMANGHPLHRPDGVLL